MAPKNVSTAVIVVAVSWGYGHPHTVAKATYSVANAGKTNATTHLNTSYSWSDSFIFIATPPPMLYFMLKIRCGAALDECSLACDLSGTVMSIVPMTTHLLQFFLYSFCKIITCEFFCISS